MWRFFCTIILVYIGVVYVGAQVSPTIAGANTWVPVGQEATITVPEGWQIVPVSVDDFAVAIHDDQWVRAWGVKIDRELSEPDPIVTDRQIAMDRAFHTPDGLCPSDRTSEASAVASLVPAGSQAESSPSGRSFQLTVIACNCGIGCAQRVADSLRAGAP